MKMTGYNIYEGTRIVKGGVWVIQQILGSYYGYVEGKRKEDDIAVKRKIMDEIHKSRTNLTNILEEFDEKAKPTCLKATKRVIDELDMFHTEVDLSEAGHRYPFFSIQKSANKHQVEKLVEFDKSLITTMENVAKATGILNDNLIDKQVPNPDRELKKIRQYISSCRNYFKDRKDYIKNIK